ncbi:hypothetical protein EJ110_NYTH00067 [Nymphaea thermarum]|nr:hypothetical protein EJ110_NYTH00067 [Nymphaea thermarum]
MKKLSPNFDREDALDTVLEVPVPEEMLVARPNAWQSVKTWMRPQKQPSSVFGGRAAEIQLLLGVSGAPLIPLPLHEDEEPGRPMGDDPLESGMAKYILEQYIAAVGGHAALDRMKSMYAMGKVKMMTSELHTGSKVVKAKNMNKGGEFGGFVLWQKCPDLWCIELVVSGCKISAGSDGKVAWRQTPWHPSHASRGPPRPLRRSLQGLDPKSTASFFSKSVCMGEKTINGEDCFILKLEAESSALRARSSKNVEIMRHTVWGYFSQKTGLLVQFEDSHMLRISGIGDDSIYWETTMLSVIQDYRQVDGILIAHSGRTETSLFRFGESSASHTRTKMEETWTIEEMDFNVCGLSMDCFLPPSDLRLDQDGYEPVIHEPLPGPSSKTGSPRDVFAVSNEETDSTEEDEAEN